MPTVQIFAEHGEVEEVFVMRGGSRSGQACAFVRFTTAEGAVAAIQVSKRAIRAGMGLEGGSNGAWPLPPSCTASRDVLPNIDATFSSMWDMRVTGMFVSAWPEDARSLAPSLVALNVYAGHPRQVHHAGLHRPPRRPLC